MQAAPEGNVNPLSDFSPSPTSGGRVRCEWVPLRQSARQRLFSRNFAPLNAMMERAGMAERAIYDRTREIFHQFHLPLDADPPDDE